MILLSSFQITHEETVELLCNISDSIIIFHVTIKNVHHVLQIAKEVKKQNKTIALK